MFVKPTENLQPQGTGKSSSAKRRQNSGGESFADAIEAVILAESLEVIDPNKEQRKNPFKDKPESTATETTQTSGDTSQEEIKKISGNGLNIVA